MIPRRPPRLVLSVALALALGIPGAAFAATQARAHKPPAKARAKGPAPGAGSALTRGRTAWLHLQTRTAVTLLKQAASSPSATVKADANVALGDIYYVRGWEQEDVFGGWHVEPDVREAALEAYRAAAAARPDWSTPHERLGRALVKDEKPSEALAEFDAALARNASDGDARFGRWQALAALNRKDTIGPELQKAAASADASDLFAAYRGYLLLGDKTAAAAVGPKVASAAPSSEMTGTVLADRIDAARAAKDNIAVITQGVGFVERFPRHSRTRRVYDTLIAAYQAMPDSPLPAIDRAIDARLALVAEPQAALVAANLLIARGSYDRAIALARRTPVLTERFVDENHAAYRLNGKATKLQGLFRASAADLVGWALFQKKDLRAAEEKLAEADRLTRGQDPTIQYHLGELAKARGQDDTARDNYLNALSLTSALSLAPPGVVAESAKRSLADVYKKLGNDPAEFDGWVSKEIARLQDDRRTTTVGSMEDQKAPALPLTSLANGTVDIPALRGKVLLLNFFSSW